MIIRQLQPYDCFRAMALWQEVFQDTQPFAAFYFAHRFTPALSFGAFEEDRIVSMALGRPVTTKNPTYQAVLIAGVCTLPIYRHQGLMSETLSRLVKNAAAHGFDLAILSPAIPDLYAQYGFHPLTYGMEVEETAASQEELQDVMPVRDLGLPFLMYQFLSGSHPFLLQRNKDDFLLTLREYAADQGVLLQTKDGYGYIAFLPGASEVEVAECFAVYPKQYRLLLRAAAAYAPSGNVRAILPADCGLQGTIVRPIHALSLKEDVQLERITDANRAFILERY